MIPIPGMAIERSVPTRRIETERAFQDSIIGSGNSGGCNFEAGFPKAYGTSSLATSRSTLKTPFQRQNYRRLIKEASIDTIRNYDQTANRRHSSGTLCKP